QFPYPTPTGWTDDEFGYWYDQFNTPGLQISLGPGEERRGVMLFFESDAEFHLKAIEINDPSGVLGVILYDPAGQAMSQDYLPVWLAFSSLSSAQNPGQCPVVFEPELVFPAGAGMRLDIKNLA